MKKVLLFIAAAVVLFAAASTAWANPARVIPPGADVVAFFVDHGVDAQYVGAPKASVPADEWKKIRDVICEGCPGSSDGKVAKSDLPACDHCRLNRLVLGDLYTATEGLYDPVKMEIGGTVWTLQLGASKDAGWVKE